MISTHIKTIIVVVGVCIGIIFGEKSNIGSEVALASFFICIAQVVLYFVTRKRDEKHRSKIALMSVLFLIAITIGVMRVQFISSEVRFICESACQFSGRIVAPPEIKDAYQVIDVRPVNENATARTETQNVRIRVPLYPSYEVGDTLTLKGKVTAPKIIPSHDGKKSFDYESYLSLNNVGSEMFFPSITSVRKTEMTMSERLMASKVSLVQKISNYVDEPVGSLSSGMLLGDTKMSEEVKQSFRVAGLSHIVVLSGFNIAVLISALLLVLRIVPLTLRVILASGMVIFFVIMVGGEASVVRATLMAFVGLLALLLGREYVAHQALVLSFLIIILFSPTSLVSDVSLHLSFLATAGIVYMNSGIQKSLERISIFSKHRTYTEIISTTLSAYIATLPYVMYTFGTASVYAVIVNFLVLPLVPIIMLLTFIAVVLSPLASILSYGIGYTVTILGGIVIWVAHTVESLPYASLSVDVSLPGMIVLYGLIVSFYLVLTRYKKDETRLTKGNEIISGVISY